MISTTYFLMFAGTAASIVALLGNPHLMERQLRRGAAVAITLLCLLLTLDIFFPSGSWVFPAALSINGAACIAHGVCIIAQLRVLSGFLFSVLGGFQLGLVLLMVAQLG